MTAFATELEKLVNEFLPLLHLLSPDELSYKPSPVKWSKKELIGHLIDSAQNNSRRFIVSQYEENPVIIYNQDKWVGINNYQTWHAQNLIQLWYLLNNQIIIILKNIPAEASHRICTTGASYTIEWLAEDYIKHLRYHMHQVLNLEPLAYP